MASSEDAEDRLKAALADRYRLERELGSGGMATVYLAEDLRHHRKVAVKVLKPEVAEAVGTDRFLREIEIAANLLHPHILPVFDSGEAGGFLFYVMPRVRGGSLRDRLEEEKQLPIDEAVAIAREVADALDHAHERDVIHRDVKPANILLSGGHALLTDFGVAQAVARVGGTRLTQTGMSLGTPAYMSPEQAAGERDLDGRSDQYALGCVLYEMLAGQPPFTGAQVETVVRQHLIAEPQPVSRLRTTVSGETDGALTRALAKSPADRFSSTREFGRALLGGGHPGPTRTDADRPRRGFRFAPVLAALAVVIIVAIASWIAYRSGETATVPATSQRVIVLPYDNQTGDPELDPIGRMVAEWITEGLARTGEVQVVPSLMVLESVARNQGAGEEPGSGVPIRELAGGMGAAIAVTGSYYQDAREIEIHSEVIDLESGQPLGAVEASRGPLTDIEATIDPVRERVMGVLATRLRAGTAWEVPASVQPPTYEAFRHYARGSELWTQDRYGEAADWFTRAYEADTTFLRSLLIAAAAHGNAGDPAASDSLVQVILPRREELAPYDRYRLDYGVAGQRGDIPARLRAARAAVELVPSGTQRLSLVMTLVDLNRPSEALESYEGVWDEVRALTPGWYRIWAIYSDILHLLGDYERELEIARQGREQAPVSLRMMALEGRALVGLGRLDAVSEIVAEILATPGEPGANAGSGLEILAAELRAHDHSAAASEMLTEALAWFRSSPQEFTQGPAGQMLLGRLLYRSEQWEEAVEVFRRLNEDGVLSSTIIGYLGATAARLGDTASAATFSRQLMELEEPYSNGHNTAWRARIEAVLGNQDDAVSLLRRAFGEGVEFGDWVHTDTDLELLQDHPGFRELIRPKG